MKNTHSTPYDYGPLLRTNLFAAARGLLRSTLFVAAGCFLLVLTLMFAGCSRPAADTEPPNIVFILIDDLGWADLPQYGNAFNEAPNIGRLASEGMRFTNAYAACPVCSPTRASIQSGQYPAHVGIIDFITGHWRPFEEVVVPRNRTQYLPLSCSTFAEYLQQAGYATAYFGKWHLGRGEYIPVNQGYDEQVVYNGGGFFGYSDRMDPPQDFPEGKVLSEALTDLSLDFIERHAGQPFLLFLSHYDVHVQLDAQENLIRKYLDKSPVPGYPCNAVYAAMVENVDRSVGRILDRLETLDLRDETLVVFFSDNGGLVSRFDRIPLLAKSKLPVYEGDTLQYIATSNAPLRAEKGTVYEGGIRVPMIASWPGRIPAGSVNKSLVSSVDFYPTLLDVAGLKPDSLPALDGTSLIEVLFEGNTLYDRPLFWHYPVYHHGQPAAAIRKGDYKLVRNLVDGSVELFNLAVDPGETRNLAGSGTSGETAVVMKQKSDELHKQLSHWQSMVNAEFPRPNPDFDPGKRHEWGRHPDRR